jgi:hypothetical protein
VKLFGFEITRDANDINDNNKKNVTPSFVPPQTDDGAVTVQTGGYFGTYVDLDGIAKNEQELITRYREMAIQPELETAIDEIVNESIVEDDEAAVVEINVDAIPFKKVVKDKIIQEFDEIMKMLDFQNMGHDIFRKWYIDGRLFYHVVIDTEKPHEGIQEVRNIDPRRIRKIREIKKVKDPRTGIELVDNVYEFYMFNDRGVYGNSTTSSSAQGIKIASDAVININSGLIDARKPMVLSYLHKAIKPLNQLRMLEDASVIYRLARAPERRIFYIDVGNMPVAKAEQYLRDTMVKYRNKLVYDSTTGEIKDDRKHLSMLEDFWLPRREGGKGTQIDTLKGGENLGEMKDVEYFERKLYKALGVPMSRLEPQQGFSLGRSTEITREELKFSKFISRLRKRFSILFDELLKRQLVMKRVINEEDWKDIKEGIFYNFLKDNNFSELKESELLQNRLMALQAIDPYVGRYFSKRWVRQNVLRQTEEEIAEIDEEIAEEIQNDPMMQQNAMGPMGMDPNGQMGGQMGMDPNMMQTSSPFEQQPQQDFAAGPAEAQANEKLGKNKKPTQQEHYSSRLYTPDDGLYFN